MTKLIEWLSVLFAFVAIYISLITNRFNIGFVDKWMFEILISPIILIGLFGVSRADL